MTRPLCFSPQFHCQIWQLNIYAHWLKNHIWAFWINNCNYPFPVCSRGQEVDIQTNLMTQNYILNESQYLLGHAAKNPATTGVWFDIPHFGDALNLYFITSRMGWNWSSVWSGTTARWVSWRLTSGRRVEEGGEESCLTFPSQWGGVGADARGVVKWWSGVRPQKGRASVLTEIMPAGILVDAFLESARTKSYHAQGNRMQFPCDVCHFL